MSKPRSLPGSDHQRRRQDQSEIPVELPVKIIAERANDGNRELDGLAQPDDGQHWQIYCHQYRDEDERPARAANRGGETRSSADYQQEWNGDRLVRHLSVFLAAQGIDAGKHRQQTDRDF